MRSLVLSFFSFIIFGISISTFAWAFGGESSGGADDYKLVLAWFRSYDQNARIQVCYQVSPQFGIEASQLEKMIHQSFEAWGNYIRDKKLMIGRSSVFIASQIDLHSSCQGNEDLIFYFGIENDEVKEAKAQYARPFGFAEFTGGSLNPQPLWGKGFIWITGKNDADPALQNLNWSLVREALSGLILHEVGHVFGNGHVDGTTMTEKIGQYLEHDILYPIVPPFTSSWVGRYSTIDSEIELVPCMTCHAKYAARPVFDPSLYPPSESSVPDWNYSFLRLTGKEPLHPLSIFFERTGSLEGSGVLTYVDSSGTYSFPVDALSLIAERTDSTALFAGQCGDIFHSFGSSYFAVLQSLSGEKIEVSVNYNMDKRKVAIIPLGGNFFPRPLFVSDGPN